MRYWMAGRRGFLALACAVAVVFLACMAGMAYLLAHSWRGAFLVSALLLSSCASLPARAEPESDELRRIREEREAAPPGFGRKDLGNLCPF